MLRYETEMEVDQFFPLKSQFQTKFCLMTKLFKGSAAGDEDTQTQDLVHTLFGQTNFQTPLENNIQTNFHHSLYLLLLLLILSSIFQISHPTGTK